MKAESRSGGKRSINGLAARSQVVGQRDTMVLMARDKAIVQWLAMARLGTREQIQQLFFTSGGRSRCQQRLTLLYRNRFIDRLPGRAVNAPEIYFLSRRATQGLRLLRTLDPDNVVKPSRVPSTLVQHTLDIASSRIAVQNACTTAGYILESWHGEEALRERTEAVGLLPDAYFQIGHRTSEGEKHANFFLEVERSGKSEQELEKKFRRYGEFYYNGGYAEVFGTRALRVLFLVGSDYGINPVRQIAKLTAIARRSDVTIFRFTPLAEFLAMEPGRLFSATIWRQPRDDARCSLF